MSKLFVDSDGFTLVNRKSSSKNKPSKIPHKDYLLQKNEVVVNVYKTKQNIYSAIEDLFTSTYFDELYRSVSIHLKSGTVVEIVCFGLGHIGECTTSKYQLALLLCLKDKLCPKKVFAHDPVFSKSECEVLKQFGINVIEENNEGTYPINSDSVTLLYLPHCPKQLTNNFLWSNWGLNLKNCILICNSFSSLIENQPSRIILNSVPFIQKIFPYTKETVVDNNFKFTDIFNDLSIHSFPAQNLELLSSNFWIKGDKPSYENTEEFITSLMIEKLTL